MKNMFIKVIQNAKYDETDCSGDFGIQKLYILRKK